MPALPFRVHLPPALSRARCAIAVRLPPANFITLHYAYFIGTCLLASLIFWGSSTPARSISYTDSLFLTVSAMSLAGLNTVNLSQMNTWQQIILFFLIMLGSTIFVSFGVLQVRQKAFERRFKAIVEEQRRLKRARSNLKRAISFPLSLSTKKNTSQPGPGKDGVFGRGSIIKNDTAPVGADDVPVRNPGDHPRAEQLSSNRPKLQLRTIEEGKPCSTSDDSHPEIQPASPVQDGENLKSPVPGIRNRISFASPTSPLRERPHKRVFTFQGIGARQDLLNHPIRTELRPEDVPPTPMRQPTSSGKAHQFAYPGFIGRNSQFSSLSLAEREQLGGVEFRAIEVLAVVVPLYFVLWQFLGALGLGAYIAHNRRDVAEVNGLNPWYDLNYPCGSFPLITVAGGLEHSTPSPRSTIQECPY